MVALTLRVVVGCESCGVFEVSRIANHCGQATKSVWRMSRRQEAMKGVLGCDKLGEVVK